MFERQTLSATRIKLIFMAFSSVFFVVVTSAGKIFNFRRIGLDIISYMTKATVTNLCTTAV